MTRREEDLAQRLQQCAAALMEIDIGCQLGDYKRLRAAADVIAVATRDTDIRPAEQRAYMLTNCKCGSDYLRVCHYPPALSKNNTRPMARVECDACKFCGPVAEDALDPSSAVRAWNEAIEQHWKDEAERRRHGR